MATSNRRRISTSLTDVTRKIAREIREFSRQPLTEAGLEIPSAQLPAAVFGTGSPPGAKFVRRRFPELLRLPAPATSDHGCRSAGKGERYALPPEILRNKILYSNPVSDAHVRGDTLV
jgi:hypothetical protein